MSTGSDEARYWRTEVSEITPDRIWVRGYDLESLIGLPFTATTFLMIRGRLPTQGEMRVLDAVLTGVLDYGLEKAGTVAARYTVSGNPNMQAGLATATLGAGAFGLATESTCRFISATFEDWTEAGRPDMDEFADLVVKRARAARQRIPGFGHPVFKDVDPRAQRLRTIAVDNGLWGEEMLLYEAVHRSFVRQPGRERFPINDVAVMAAISVGLGFTPEESTALAIIGTLPGVVAHISEEFRSGRPGRAVPPDDVDYHVPRRDLAVDLAGAGW